MEKPRVKRFIARRLASLKRSGRAACGKVCSGCQRAKPKLLDRVDRVCHAVRARHCSRLPRIYWPMGMTSGGCRSCWGIRTLHARSRPRWQGCSSARPTHCNLKAAEGVLYRNHITPRSSLRDRVRSLAVQGLRTKAQRCFRLPASGIRVLCGKHIINS
jgi:hypothetical protein